MVLDVIVRRHVRSRAGCSVCAHEQELLEWCEACGSRTHPIIEHRDETVVSLSTWFGASIGPEPLDVPLGTTAGAWVPAGVM